MRLQKVSSQNRIEFLRAISKVPFNNFVLNSGFNFTLILSIEFSNL